jgi:GAF domain-containing protein
MKQHITQSHLAPDMFSWAALLTSNDCEPVENLDSLTKDAAILFGVPIAMINIVTSRHIVFKSCIGLMQGDKLDKHGAFCGKAVSFEAPFVVPDATQDTFFKMSPLVLGPLGIRSYAGKSLHAPDGSRIGTLCLLDTKTRNYRAFELRGLVELAKSAEEQLHLLLAPLSATLSPAL